MNIFEYEHIDSSIALLIKLILGNIFGQFNLNFFNQTQILKIFYGQIFTD